MGAVMSLYAAGRTTGLVVDSGDGVSHTVPVFEGFSIPHAVEKMEIAGRVLTEWLQKLLVNHAAENFTSSAEKEIVKNIKEELCYVAQNFDEESKVAQGSSENDKPYTLPDKRVINVGGIVRMSCPELLFKPSLSGMTAPPSTSSPGNLSRDPILISERISARTSSSPVVPPCTLVLLTDSSPSLPTSLHQAP